MFEGLKNIGALGSMLKQAQQMGPRLKELAEQLKHCRVVGSAGAGLVTIEANGLAEVLSCRIDPTLLVANDRDRLETLVVLATNDALLKAKMLHAEEVRRISGGLDMPGMDEMMQKLGGGN